MNESQKKQHDKSTAYWEKREAANLVKNLRDEKQYEREIERIYKDMLDACQKEIDAFYERYSTTEGITIADAKKRVRQIDMDAYERKAKKYVKAAQADMKKYGKDYKNAPNAATYFSEQANEEMRLYNLTMKVNRLEMLKANIGLELIKGHSELEAFMGDILQGRTEAELKRQAGILGKTIRNNSQKAHTIVNASFHNATFSQRIWANQSQLKADLAKLLESGLIAGKSSRQLAKDLRKYFVPDPKKDSRTNARNAAKAAERLMRTELARVQTAAQQEMMIRNGFTQYTFIVNSGCCDVCQEIADHNGGHYALKDMMPGKNAPPIHPYCRCSVAAYDESDDYHEWLNFLAGGGTTEEYNALKAKGSPIPKKKRIAKPVNGGKIKAQNMDVSNFPDAFNTKTEQPITQKLVDYVNKLKGANPTVLKLYGKMKNFESLVSEGIPFKISHAKDCAVETSSSRATGTITNSKLTIPKLTGDNIAGQVNTTLHELAHLMDLYCRKDKKKDTGWFGESRKSLVDAFKRTDSSISIEMSNVFAKHNADYRDIRDSIKAKYNKKFAELKEKHFEAGIVDYSHYAKYKAYEKEYNKMQSEMVTEIGIEARNMSNGVGHMQDIYDALSGGKYRDGGAVIYGHGSQYFKHEDLQIKEVFANYVSLSVTRPDLIEILRKDKPELVAELDATVKAMLELAED